MSRAPRWPMAIPRLETLEDRTLMTATLLEPPVLLPAPEELPVGRYREGVAIDPSSVVNNVGMQRLLNSVRMFQAAHTASITSDAGVSMQMQMRLTGSSLLEEAPTTFNQTLPTPATQAAPPAVAPSLPQIQSAPSSLEVEPAETTVAQPTERPTSRPEPRRAARPLTLPGNGLQGASAEQAPAALATPTTPATPRTSPEPSQQFITMPNAARPSMPQVESARLDARDALPPARPVVPTDSPASRAEAMRYLAELPDGSLLQRFVTHREEAAFTVLVQRHERIVLGVCQRVLGDTHAAQDALQATFLVLARKASRLDLRNPLTGWLYKVAYHLALRLRAVAARQRRYEQQAANGRTDLDDAEISDIEERELRQALYEELQRLPEKYRTPLILCYFDGCTHDEAARTIGMPRGSMAKRIGEGLERLRERLSDRGFIF